MVAKVLQRLWSNSSHDSVGSWGAEDSQRWQTDNVHPHTQPKSGSSCSTEILQSQYKMIMFTVERGGPLEPGSRGLLESRESSMRETNELTSSDYWESVHSGQPRL